MKWDLNLSAFFTSLTMTRDLVRLLRNFRMTVWGGWGDWREEASAGGISSFTSLSASLSRADSDAGSWTAAAGRRLGRRCVTSTSSNIIGGWILRSLLKSFNSLSSRVPAPSSRRPWILIDPRLVHCSISSILSCRSWISLCWVAMITSFFLIFSLYGFNCFGSDGISNITTEGFKYVLKFGYNHRVIQGLL